ncbi:MAG: DegV family protein [Lachnospiraceae bacterium]|nr:DegV family protein [Lachnospiraceae bacterium]
MSKVAILTDTNSGLCPDDEKGLGIFVMPMPMYIDDTQYYEYVDIDKPQFFKMLETADHVTTSMPPAGDVMDKFEELLKDHDEVVYIPMSSGLSSSCSTAYMLADDFDGKVHVVDNQRIAVTMRLSVMEAKALADQGKSGSEIREYLEDHKMESSIYITVATLKYLKKGGRLTPAVAALGTILRIKPVLQIQGDKLDTFAKARTMKQAKDIMLDAIESDLTHRFGAAAGEGCVISIAHTQNEGEAQEFKKEAEARFPGHTIQIDPLPLSIACHIGPGALAITVSKSFLDKF